MAIRFDASTDGLVRTSNVINMNSAYTVMVLMRFASNPGSFVFATFFSINRDSGTANFEYLSVLDSSGLRIAMSINNGGGATSHATSGIVSVNTWYWVAMVRNSVTNLSLHLAQPGSPMAGATGTHTTDVTSRLASTRHEVGAHLSGNAQPFSTSAGRIGAIKLWQGALSVAEMTSEMGTIRPQRYTNLHSWYSCWPDYHAVDFGPNGYNWTVDGTLTDEAGPPVTWGARPIFVLQPASGDALEADGITTGTPTLGTPSIAQTHAITAGAITTGAPTVDSPTLGQAHALTVADVATGVPTVDSPTIGQAHVLTADAITTGAPVLDTPSLADALTVDSIVTGAPTLGTPTIAQTHGLTAADITAGAPVLDTPTIGQTHVLTATGITTGAPTMAASAIGQIHALITADITTGAPTLGSPVFGIVSFLRTFIVAGENRTYPVRGENRTFFVE